MPISVYDRLYDEAERAKSEFKEATNLRTKRQAIQTMQSAAHEFGVIASDLDDFITEAENELFEAEQEGEV